MDVSDDLFLLMTPYDQERKVAEVAAFRRKSEEIRKKNSERMADIKTKWSAFDFQVYFQLYFQRNSQGMSKFISNKFPSDFQMISKWFQIVSKWLPNVSTCFHEVSTWFPSGSTWFPNGFQVVLRDAVPRLHCCWEVIRSHA